MIQEPFPSTCIYTFFKAYIRISGLLNCAQGLKFEQNEADWSKTNF
jgi:hypothetical protein